ncbi:MAG: radical SAM protein [bacterium]|nr:radical SAM protein [bacterium]
MKTILINPDAKLYRSIPPLALAYVATSLGAKVIDQNTKPDPKDRFLNYHDNEVGIFVRSVSFSESKRIARLYQEKNPKVKIKSIFTPIDVQCCYPTLQFESQINFTKPFGDNYPFPDFSLFDSFDVWSANWRNGSWPYGILTSVGCPFQCSYCAARNRGWTARSPKNCVEELKLAKKKYKIVSFEILDDAFNINKNRVLEFCKLVKPLKLRWICANGLRADLFNEEQACAMAGAGCDSVAFGVESIDPVVLKNIKKGETIEQISKAVDIAKKYFKTINGFFIIGLPGSSYKKDLKSVEWVVKRNISGVFSFYVPIGERMESDDMFYGSEAKPQSDEYPKHLQNKIYKMVEYMQGPTTPVNFILRVYKTLNLVWKFDRQNFSEHLMYNIKRFI